MKLTTVAICALASVATLTGTNASLRNPNFIDDGVVVGLRRPARRLNTQRYVRMRSLAETVSVEQTEAFKNAVAQAQEECAAQQDAALNAQAEKFDAAMKKFQKAAKAMLIQQKKDFEKVFAQAQEDFAAQQDAATAECAARQDAALNAQAETFDATMKAVQKQHNRQMQEQLVRQAEEVEGMGLSLDGEAAIMGTKRELCDAFHNDRARLTRVCATR